MWQAICMLSEKSHCNSRQNLIDLLYNFSVYRFGKYENSLADMKQTDENLVLSDLRT